ncbi:hypothetical protein ACFFHJ_22645 [Planotetraspora thailandica]|nr:hypothetical protein [Planotetraspora thailandica]
MGLRSNMMYTAGLASVGLSVVSWVLSQRYESAGTDRADRWGLFVGEWAPTLFAMGVALRLEEMRSEKERGTAEWRERTMERAPGMPSRAGV